MKRSLAGLGLCVYIAASCLLAYFFPQSVLAFLMVEASLLLLYYIDAPRQTKIFLGALVLISLPVLIAVIFSIWLASRPSAPAPAPPVSP